MMHEKVHQWASQQRQQEHDAAEMLRMLNDEEHPHNA
jgi:hypothetical protein